MKPGRRFDDPFYRKNARFWSYLDIPGGVWLTLFSGSLLAMWWICFLYNLKMPAEQRIGLPGGAEPTYIAILTAFAASNIFRWYTTAKERICGVRSPESSASES